METQMEIQTDKPQDDASDRRLRRKLHKAETPQFSLETLPRLSSLAPRCTRCGGWREVSWTPEHPAVREVICINCGAVVYARTTEGSHDQ